MPPTESAWNCRPYLAPPKMTPPPRYQLQVSVKPRYLPDQSAPDQGL
jgi:hypothetical protein